MRRTILCAVASFAAVALLSGAAHAIPAFARRYEASCRTCHAGAFPELNPLGRRFLENGYQLPRGAEAPFRERAMIQPGPSTEKMGLLAVLPLALRAESSIQIPVDFGATGRNAVDFRMLERLTLLGGAAINRDVSFLASVALWPSPKLMHGAMGLHNLFFGEGYLNFRAGQFLLFDFLRPSHRLLTRTPNLGAQVRVGKNPTVLDTSHLGFDLYGRLFGRRLFWELAVVQGAEGLDGIADLDSAKDVFGQLQWTIADRHTVGALGYFGNTSVPAAETAPTFDDRFFVAGGNIEVALGPATLFAQVLYGRHANPSGDGRAADYVGLRAMVDVLALGNMVALVRYDGVISEAQPSLARHVLTAHFTHLPSTNFKQSIEISVDLRDWRRSTVLLLLDLGI